VHKWRYLYSLIGCAATSAVSGSMGATSQDSVTITASFRPKIVLEKVDKAGERPRQAICLTHIAGEFSARLESQSGNSMPLPVWSMPGQRCTSVQMTEQRDAGPPVVFFVAE